MKVHELLEERGAEYGSRRHDETFTAQSLAHVLHVSGDNIAKTVILKADGEFVVAVLPASRFVDLQQARRALGADSLKLASEAELEHLFPDCQVGAVPPFGSQYGLRTLVDRTLRMFDDIVFEANRHDEVVNMHYRDFERIEHPLMAEFSHHL